MVFIGNIFTIGFGFAVPGSDFPGYSGWSGYLQHVINVDNASIFYRRLIKNCLGDKQKNSYSYKKKTVVTRSYTTENCN